MTMNLSAARFATLPYRLKLLLTTPALVRGRAGAFHWLSRPQPDIEPWTANWMSRMLAMCLEGREGAFLDVGVHRLSTYFDLRSFDQGRPYVGIEPNLASASIAAEAIRLSGDASALVLPCAAANVNGILDLWVRKGIEHDSCATMLEDLRPALAVERFAAPAVTLDTVAEKLCGSRLALIKIDVEGGELEVLSGARRCLSDLRVPVICEVLLRDKNADRERYLGRVQQLCTLLQENQYDSFHIRKDAKATGVTGLDRVSNFPDRIWEKADQEACDYLFLPRGSRFKGLDRLLP